MELRGCGASDIPSFPFEPARFLVTDILVVCVVHTTYEFDFKLDHFFQFTPGRFSDLFLLLFFSVGWEIFKVWDCFGDHHRSNPFKPGPEANLWRGGSNPFAGLDSSDYVQRLAQGQRWPLELTDDDDAAAAASTAAAVDVGSSVEGAAGGKWQRPCQKELRDVCRGCWNLEPNERPSMPDLTGTLQALAESLVPISLRG